jgi:TolB protein
MRFPCVGLLGVLAMLAFAGGTQSTRSPALISYGTSYGPGLSAGGGLCIARADGSHAVRLTNRRRIFQSSWSPGGRFVAFSRATSERERGRNETYSEIYISDARGHLIRNISRSFAVFNTDPAWSPDGRLIAFTGSWHGSVVVLTRRNGTHRRQLSGVGGPEWSPDGKRLLFDRAGDVYSVNRAGGDLQLVLRDAESVDVSPDGARLAFVRRSAGLGAEIVVARADGSDARPLTSSPESESQPAWSPDGKLLAFTRWDANPVTDRRWVVVVHSDTGEEYAVIRGPRNAFAPSWRPAVTLPHAKRDRCR